MHYHPSHEHDVHVKKEGMLLIDSGRQYLDGTTDITRTFILGEISETERKYFICIKSYAEDARSCFLIWCKWYLD